VVARRGERARHGGRSGRITPRQPQTLDRHGEAFDAIEPGADPAIRALAFVTDELRMVASSAGGAVVYCSSSTPRT